MWLRRDFIWLLNARGITRLPVIPRDSFCDLEPSGSMTSEASSPINDPPLTLRKIMDPTVTRTSWSKGAIECGSDTFLNLDASLKHRPSGHCSSDYHLFHSSNNHFRATTVRRSRQNLNRTEMTPSFHPVLPQWGPWSPATLKVIDAAGNYFWHPMYF